MTTKISPIRLALGMLYCGVLVAFSFWLACQLRYDFAIPQRELPLLYSALLLAVLTKSTILCLHGIRLDRCLRFATFSDFVDVLRANLLASLCASAAIWIATAGQFPRSIYLLDLLICVPLSGSARFAARAYSELLVGRLVHKSAKGLIVYGAGVAGLALAREIRSNPRLGYQVLGFVDDDPRKQNAKLLGLPVLGSGDALSEIVESLRHHRPPVDDIVVAMPSATGREMRAARERGQATGARCRIVPGLGELISGNMSGRGSAPVSVTDLLGREPVQLNQERVRQVIYGRTVMVTGAAGSIGSELCDQLAKLGPGRLIAFDQAESELFRLEGDLRSRYPGLSLSAEIGDIRDPRRLDEVLQEHRVDRIFHAAAYKHVSLMEHHVCEAVRTNVLGTWNVLQAAWRANVSSVLLISSDKAVNPSGVMGLTKRVAELMFSADRSQVGAAHITKFVCVRFGNVLVSNGSVVPIFQKQIAAGGPVTVTHADVRRYFMTVQEAVQLVLEASAMGKRSDIFVLDMGKPMRILDLAEKMIVMAGLRPGKDIQIRYTGLHPGEKLFEELRLDSEDLLPTSHQMIRIFQGRRVPFDAIVPWIAELQHLLWRRDQDAILQHLQILAPEYQGHRHLEIVGSAPIEARAGVRAIGQSAGA